MALVVALGATLLVLIIAVVVFTDGSEDRSEWERIADGGTVSFKVCAPPARSAQREVDAARAPARAGRVPSESQWAEPEPFRPLLPRLQSDARIRRAHEDWRR